MRTVYESMRLQTFFQFSLQVNKKYRKSFAQFCKSYMPFSWDIKDKEVIENQERLNNMTPDDWAELDRRMAIMNGSIKPAEVKE